MNSVLLLGALQQGLLYAVMALGVYITFRILDLPDLTVDGSFTLGMSITAVITLKGYPVLGLLAAVCLGMVAGTVTGLLQTKMRVHPIVAGILVMTSLYSINLMIMSSRSNLPIIGHGTIFSNTEKALGVSLDVVKTVLPLILYIIITLLLALLFKTKLGLSIRATGDNEDMVRSSSINADFIKCLGLALGNGLVALSGGLMCQYSMVSDVTSGTGMVIIGLASVIIGETFFGRRSVTIGLISAGVGAVLYRIILAFALKFNFLPPYALKLVASIIVAAALMLPAIKKNIEERRIRKGGLE